MNRWIARSAGIVLLASTGTAMAGVDRLVLRDGASLTGKLRACSEEKCRLDSSSIPLDAILWIGLDAEEGARPPGAPAEPGDTVILTDGTRHGGALVGLSLGMVATARGEWDRENVAWIFLAPRPGSPPVAQPPIVRPEEEPAPGSSPETAPSPAPATPRSGPAPAPRPRRVPGDGVEPCPPGNPLGAHIELRTSGTANGLAFSRTGKVKIWFDLAPSGPSQWRYELSQPWSASHLTWRTEASGCVDLPDSYGEVCRCSPSRASGVVDFPGDSGYGSFYPLDPQLSVHLPDSIMNSADVPFECVRRDAGSSGRIGLFASGVEDVRPYENSTVRAFFVAATGCFDAEGRMSPDCAAHPELYAVIPFAGSDRRTDAYGSDEVTRTMRWEVCCGCGIPPREMPEGENDPCGDPDQQRGLLEVAVDRANALRAQTAPRIQGFEQHWRQAEAFKSDFELVVNSCAGWDIATTLLGYLAGGPNATQSAQAFSQGLGMLQQLLVQDPALVLSAGSAFGLEGWDVVNDSWGLLSTLYSAGLDISSAGSVAGMKAKLADCARVPLVSHLVYDDAKLHLEHLEKALTELREIHRLSTETEQADTEVVNRWGAFHRACLENAQCRGLDPALCGPPPP